ncbi:MAG: penicillin acylase family protein [Bacteroidetes bacterium]|nr:penicillin acylase family protein [Bacteroidota bacterium]
MALIHRWRSWVQGTIGLIVTVLVLIVCFVFFAVKIATRSHPKPYTELTAPVNDTTRIFRNSFGVPHITARNENDLFAAQGFAHAQDRLWQMDFMRRIGRGTLAAVLGKEAVDIDKFMRTLDIASIARRQLQQSSKQSRAVLSAYASGVNTYLEQQRGDLPFEFDALGYVPDAWTEEDCLIVGRVLSFQLSFAFYTDVTFAQIAAQRTEAVARQYIAGYPANAPCVLDSILQDSKRSIRPSDSVATASSLPSTASTEAMRDLTRLVRSVREKLGINGSSIGSNCWAVSLGKEGAIVANDPHLSISLPSQWYQIHLSCPSINVIGMSIPGVPMVFSGRNDKVAWGFSNVMVDDVDYFTEHVDSSNANYYFDADGRRTKFRYRRDTIRIKDKPDSLFDIRYTKRSAVLSDVAIPNAPSVQHNTCLTYRWIAQERSDEILAMYRINQARTYADVDRALNTWATPSLNISVGCIDGTIGTIVAGRIPIRTKTDPHFLNPGWDASFDWQGTQLLKDLGSLRDPSHHFVASANNRTMRANTPFISSLWESSSRVERIIDQLFLYREYTVRDAQVMQQDVVSPYAQQFMRIMLPILQRGHSRYGTMEREALSILKKWDGSFSTVEPAASIYAAFFDRMIWNTFEDELGEQLFMDYTFTSNIPTRRIMEMITDSSSVLFDDIRTRATEDVNWIAIRSFIEAVRSLNTTFEAEPPLQWRYGAIHSITFSHPFGKHPLMRPVMDQGPFEIGGNATTINNTESRLNTPFTTRVYASMRIINDLRDTVQYSVVPGGSSGQPLDAHYSDQVQLWLKGGYVRLPVRRRPDVSFRLYTILTPQ